jgi:putative two-component system response regulator
MEVKRAILVVDDMPISLRTVQVILEEFFDIHLARSGEEALSILNTTRIDLILLDIEMPSMSGFEFFDLLRKLPYEDIPVIFVTSHASPEYVTHALKDGAKGYVMKPYQPETLLKKVIGVLDIKNLLVMEDGKCVVVPTP